VTSRPDILYPLICYIPPVRQRPLAVIFAIAFIDLMGFGIVIPLLPLYGERYRPTPLSFGLLLSSYSALQFLFAPVLGRLSDRYGRKPILLLSLAGSAAGYVLFGLARSLSVLFAARIIDGISGGNISTAQAYVADVTEPEERARGMGMIGAAFGLGFIFGPAIAGFSLHLGESAPGFVAAGMSCAALVAAALFLEEPARRTEEGSRLAARSVSGSDFLAAVRQPVVAGVLAVFFLATFAFANFEATFSQFLHDAHALPVARVSFVFTYIGVLIALVQGLLVPRVSRSLGEGRMAAAGLLMLAAGLLLLPLAPSVVLTMGVLVPLTVGIGLTNPSLSSLISKSVSADQRGGVLGVYQSMSSLGRILGPLWGEFVFFRLGPSGPHWTGGLFAGAAMLLSLILLRGR
jgi:DHA1 family tetracycline resistance protein-like MFS transporter